MDDPGLINRGCRIAWCSIRMIKLIAHIPCALVNERWRIPRGEQRDKDSSEKDQQSEQNAQIHEPAFAEAMAGRSGRRNSPRARDPMWELSGAFLFHGGGVPLKLDFYINSMRAVETICRCLIRCGTSQQLLPLACHGQSGVT